MFQNILQTQICHSLGTHGRTTLKKNTKKPVSTLRTKQQISEKQKSKKHNTDFGENDEMITDIYDKMNNHYLHHRRFHNQQ